MARVELKLPSQFVFSTELRVRVTDLNYGNHVGNDAVLALMHEARLQFYQGLGFKDEISFDGRIGQVISDAVIVYKAEAFYGDVLTCKIAVEDFNNYGFDVFYLIENKNSEKEIARGKTGIVCFDYEKRKIAPAPAILLERLRNAKAI